MRSIPHCEAWQQPVVAVINQSQSGGSELRLTANETKPDPNLTYIVARWVVGAEGVQKLATSYYGCILAVHEGRQSNLLSLSPTNML